MGKSKELTLPETPHPYTGVEITYIKNRDMLDFTCFYDGGYGGMNGVEISVKDFCNKLGIDLKKKRE